MVLNAPDIDPATFGDAVFWAALALVLVTQFGIFGLLRTRFDPQLSASFADHAFVTSAAGGPLCRPAGAFDLDWQIRILFIVIVGGAGTLEGPLIGTAIYFLKQLAEALITHIFGFHNISY